MAMEPQVLLKISRLDGRSVWLSGRTPESVLVAESYADVLPVLSEVERATQQGLTAVGFVAYEAAHGLDRAFPQACAKSPLAWFALYRRLEAHGAAPLPPLGCEQRIRWRPTLSERAYRCALERIRAYIEAGDVYQVNYTFRLRSEWSSEPSELLTLFGQLYHAQPVPYAAYINTGAQVILSLSPELFFALEGERIITRPMKGTAPRGVGQADDLWQAQALRTCAKNRAENLMIVDMARNDLGRIARVGSVRVPRLFEAERYATLWQMTSTVEACSDAPLPEIFRALFPAASITGAPKIRATQIIRELETTPRGVYTGAIGVVAPHRRAQFNVAIRTLVYDRAEQQMEYGVGSGVVWDSDPHSEYEECLAKAQVLLRRAPEFELLETLLWRPRGGYFLLEQHLQRLLRSADYFGFSVDAGAVRAKLLEAAQGFTASLRYRVRVRVNRRGEACVEYAPLSHAPHPWRVALAAEPVNPRDVFLYHKTTHRAVYEQARAAHPNCDDVILWNTRGEITESTIANVAVRLDGRLYTPPVACGLLAGVYRERLLKRGWLRERVIRVDELARAEAIYLINSVRGRVRAQLIRA